MMDLAPERDQDTSPRPWRVNQAYLDQDGPGEDPPPIFDANGAPVIVISEWCGIKPADLELIVRAVNALPRKEPGNAV